MKARLTVEERTEIKRLYQDEGWRVMHLARKFNIHHSTVQTIVQYVHRSVPAIDYCPDGLEIGGNKSVNRPRLRYTYEEYLEEEMRRRIEKRQTCEHPTFAIICLRCGTHFEETKTQPARAKVIMLEYGSTEPLK